MTKAETPSASGQGQPLSRRGVIVAAVNEVTRCTSLSSGSLALEFLTQYRERVPPEQRTLNLPESGDVLRDAEAIRKTMERWLRGQGMHMPIEAEEPLVYSLPEPYRSECINALAVRYGLIPISISDLTPDEHEHVTTADLLLVTSNALGAIARGDLSAAVRDLDRLIAAAASARVTILSGGTL